MILASAEEAAAEAFATAVEQIAGRRQQSQINLAYAQYKDNKPDDAYSTVNRFIKTYPTHRHIDYAYYLRGLINFNRSAGFVERWVGQDMTKRDQANQRQSFDDFTALITRYPNSAYAEDSRQRMIYLRNMMAESELHIAVFYFRRNAYVAAANRAKSIIETYPQSPQAGDALAIMVESDRAARDRRERPVEVGRPCRAPPRPGPGCTGCRAPVAERGRRQVLDDVALVHDHRRGRRSPRRRRGRG